MYNPFNGHYDTAPSTVDPFVEVQSYEPLKPRSDFQIAPPRMKVDSLVSDGLKMISDVLTSFNKRDWTNYLKELYADLDKKTDLIKKDYEAHSNSHAKLENELSQAKLPDEREQKEQLVKNSNQEGAIKKSQYETLEAKMVSLKEEIDALEKDNAGTFLALQNLVEVNNELRNRGLIGRGSIESYFFKKELMSAGITGEIAKTSSRLRKSSFDNNLKLILSVEPIYAYCLYLAYSRDNVKDADSFMNRVVHYADEVQQHLDKIIAKAFYSKRKVAVEFEEFISAVSQGKYSYEAGAPVQYLESALNSIMKYGKLPKYVNDFFVKNEIPTEKATPSIKQKMVEYLYKLNLPIKGDKLPYDKYDEYFANAYAYASKMQGDAGDPIKNVYSDVQVDNFDFEVDYFDTVEQQTIDRQNIKAAAVLFYNKILADDLGVLRVADAVIMAWTQGRLDIPQGETATKLYRYYKLRKERTTPEERAMFYKVVFNNGNAEVLENSVVNTEFGELWSTLMKETVKYIQKYETKENASEYVSKIGVYNSIKNLQYNLSVFMSGMVKSLLPEMYAQLTNAFDILKRPEVVQQLGQGYHRNMWKVIEKVSAEAFGYVPNVSALRTIAVKGHSIFRTIAEFDEAQFLEEDFRIFIGNVEEFIVANGQVEIKDYEEDGEEKELLTEEKDEWNF
jgi:hypothetical protein